MGDLRVSLIRKEGTDREGRPYLKSWYVSFYQDGHRTRRSLHTKDEAAARAHLVEMERKIALGLFDPWREAPRQAGVTIAEAVRRFLADRAGCSAATLTSYRRLLGLFERHFYAGALVASLREKDVQGFLDRPKHRKKPFSSGTRDLYRRVLRLFFSWCREAGLTDVMPVPSPLRVRGKARHVGQRQGAPPFLSEAEFGRLCRAISDQATRCRSGEPFLDVVRFAVCTGLRAGEICFLRWNAVDLEAGLLHVRNTEEFSTKSGKERTVPLVGDARAVIEARMATAGPDPSALGGGYVFHTRRGARIKVVSLSRRFRQARITAGLPEVLHFHSLRHTFASWFVQRKGNLYVLSKILGHEGLTMTMRYAHLRPDSLQAEMQATFGTGPLTPPPAPPPTEDTGRLRLVTVAGRR